MAALTDEERMNAIMNGVEDGEELHDPDEAAQEEQEVQDDDVEQPGGDDDVTEDDDRQEEPEDGGDGASDEPDGTFTKQFPNLKGDDWAAYGASLEEAYDNSFKEGLRLFEENKSLKAENAQLRQMPAQPQPGAPDPQQGNQPQPPVPASQAQEPDWAIRAQERDRRDMLDSFDPFKKEYPQVLESQNFEAFKNASDGVKDTLSKTLGRTPTWPELFNGIAGLLQWQPATPVHRKNAALKDATAGAPSAKGQSRPSVPKKEKFSDDQINAYIRMYPHLTKEQAVKELSEDN